MSGWLCGFKPAPQMCEESADGALAAGLRLEEWVRAGSNGRDPLLMFALVAGQGRRDAVQRDAT